MATANQSSNEILPNPDSPPEGIFKDTKFFIQKDLPVPEATLIDAIQAEGGRVEAKVPIKGYILIQPGSPEAARLRQRWEAPDRPGRYFVPWTWVDACREHGTLLKQIFIQNGTPMKIHIHPSIANPASREIISNRITHCGGDPASNEEEALVILADRDTDVFERLAKSYHSYTNKYVESHLWVKKCIDRGFVVHTPSAYRNPGGRRPGDERTAFTEEDEGNLCHWIASVIPCKEAGGRTGNKLYQELVSRVNDYGFEWVSRHTWQSWRERYKKNAARLDKHIEAIVNAQQIPNGGKTQLTYIPQTGHEQPKKPKKRAKKQYPPDAGPSNADVGSGSVAVDSLDSQESGWEIRHGNEPPPAWAKRSFDSHPAESSPTKKMRTGEHQMVHQFQALIMHPVDQGIQEIATESRFTVEEVREFYDKTGDMAATRDRFSKMRTFLNSMVWS